MARQFAIRRGKRGTVTVNVLEVHRRMEAGTLTDEDRAVYKRVFGCEPEQLHEQAQRAKQERDAHRG